jgi:HSP20 family protein
MDMRSLLPFGRRDVAAAEDPFTAMRREMERVFEDMTKGMSLTRPAFGLGPMAPRMDVKETDAAIEITAELPGVEEKDVEVELVGDVLTIRGEKRQSREEGEKDKGWYLMERAYGSFLRQVPLPVEVEADKVEARFEKGVLHVTLPKSAPAAARARKIAIKGS